MGDEAGGRRVWGVVRVEVPEELAEELAGRIGYGALGVEIADAGRGRSRLSVYLETAEQARVSAARIREILDAVPRSAGSRSAPTVGTVTDDRWVERYQERLRPLPLGRRFVVAPPDSDCGNCEGRVAIRMVPGRAFGTGEHPTTRLCAAALEREVEPGSRWLDVGTGSGILALVAALSGAERVVAVDVDPESVEVARRWIAANGLEDRIDLRATGAGALAGEAADGVVVNVSAPYVADAAADLARALRPGGTVVASGFLSGDLEGVATRLREAGFREAGRSESDGWACVVARLEREEPTWAG